MGHADSKTTQIYSHCAPSEREVQMVNEAFALEPEVGRDIDAAEAAPEQDQDC